MAVSRKSLGNIARKAISAVISLALLLLFLLIPVRAIDTLGKVASAEPDSIANHAVISEIEIVDSEWVERYNPTNSDVDMGGWYWCYFS